MSGQLYPRGKNTRYPQDMRQAVPRAGLDAMAKRKKSHHCPCRELNAARPARSLVTILTELLRLRPGSRWEDNIRTDLGEIGWEVVNWMRLA
jgi:hypothetical protein